MFIPTVWYLFLFFIVHQCHHIMADYMYNENMSSFVMNICMMLHKIATNTVYDSNGKEEDFSRIDIIKMLKFSFINSHISRGGRIHQYTVGIIMGTKYAHLLFFYS